MSQNKAWVLDLKRALSLGMIICCAQIATVLLIAPKSQDFAATYLKLSQWDSFHYQDILERGYQVPAGELTPTDVHSNRANAGFFPAFPIIAKGIQSLLGMSSKIALIFTAQVFCFLFWTLVLLILQDWKVPNPLSLFICISLSLFPASFFLVAGYTESLFLSSLMGMIFWTDKWIKKTKMNKFSWEWGVSILCGIILSSTRLVGIPLVIYPLLKRLVLQNDQKKQNQWFRVGLLTFLASWGGLGFFLWSYFKFGQWDIYLKLQHLGWGNDPDFLAILYPTSYLPKLFFEDTTTSVCKISNLAILVMIAYSVRKFQKENLGLISLSICMFVINLSAKANYSMDSMVRYNLPVFILLVLVFVKKYKLYQYSDFLQKMKEKFTIEQKIVWALCYILSLAFQIWMIRVFTKGGWVA